MEEEITEMLANLDESDPEKSFHEMDGFLSKTKGVEPEMLGKLHVLRDFFKAQKMFFTDGDFKSALSLMQEVDVNFVGIASDNMRLAAKVFIDLFRAQVCIENHEIVSGRILLEKVMEDCKQLKGYGIMTGLAFGCRNDCLALEGLEMTLLGKWEEGLEKFEAAKMNMEELAFKLEKSNTELYQSFKATGCFFRAIYDYERLVDDLFRFDCKDKYDYTALRNMDQAICGFMEGDLEVYAFKKNLMLARSFLMVANIVTDVKRKIVQVERKEGLHGRVFSPIKHIEESLGEARVIFVEYGMYRAVNSLQKISDKVVNLYKFIFKLSEISVSENLALYRNVVTERKAFLLDLLEKGSLDLFFKESIHCYADRESLEFLIHQNGVYNRLKRTESVDNESIEIEKNKVRLNLVDFVIANKQAIQIGNFQNKPYVR